jgi:hypothetical protein
MRFTADPRIMTARRTLVLVAATMATMAFTATARASLIWTGDFETGDLSQYQLGDTLSDHQYCNPDDAVVYKRAAHRSWPAPVQGKYAVRLKAENTDVSPCTPTANPRSQLGSAPIMEADTAVFETWSMYVPATFPDVPSAPTPTGNPFLVTQEDFAAPFSGSPPLGFGIHDAGDGVDVIDLRIDDGFGTSVWKTPLERGRWYRFVVEKNVASEEGVGWIRVSVDGEQQTFTNCTAGGGSCPDPTTYSRYTLKPGSTDPNRFYIANYRRADQTPEAVSLFFDDVRVGTTPDDVAQ